MFLVLVSLNVEGQQNIQFSQGKVDEGMSHSIGVPLGQYKGRGIGLPVTLNYSSNVWRIDNINTVVNSQFAALQTMTQAVYAEHSTSGWKSSLDLPKIEWPKLTDTYYFSGKAYCYACASGTVKFRVARVTVHMPDGSSHELRRTDVPYQDQGSIDMNGTFYAVDGSRMRYDSFDASNGILYAPDGTRYVLGQPMSYVIDRNGNTQTYNGTTRQWTDTIGRVIASPIPATPLAQDYTYSLPGLAGVNGGLQTYIFRWRNLADALTPLDGGGTPALKVMASHYLPNNTQEPTAPSGNNFPQPQSGLSLFASEVGEEATVATMVVGKGQTAGQLFNPVVLAEIVLPNGTSYKFSYNIFGEVDKVVYPTTAFEKYQVQEIGGSYNLSAPYDQANRGVVNRKLSIDGTGNDFLEWKYAKAAIGTGSWGSGTEGADVYFVRAPDNTRTEVYKLKVEAPFHGSTDHQSQYWAFDYMDARNGASVEKRSYSTSADGLGGSMLRREVTEYATSIVQVPPRLGLGGEETIPAYRNIRPTKQVGILFEGTGSALSQTTTFSYDTTYETTTGLDQTGVNSCHFAVLSNGAAQTSIIASIPAGNLARSNETTFLNESVYRNANILELATETRVLNPNTSEVLAKSLVVYDEVAYFDNSFTTTNWTDPGSTLRGNVTTTKTWVKETNTWLESHAMFDNLGNTRKVWDTSGDPNRYIEAQYSSEYKYAYPTKTLSKAPDPAGTSGTSEGSEISRVYDFHTGLLLSVTDANGQTATNEYNDPLLRPTRIVPPAGGSILETIYNDTPNNIWVKSRQQIDEANWAESTTFYDNLGRAVKARTKDLQGDVMSQVKFDSFGRVQNTSNPYRVDASGNPTETVYWSKLRYDEQNRVVETFAPAPDGQTGMSLGTVQFGISTLPDLVGTYVTAIDPSGRKSRAITGIYGLMRVDEATGKGGTIDQDLGSLEYPIQPTSYSYNIKGEMTKITQGSQNRYFMYDSLGRLIRVRQPEQTPNSNLATSENPENNQWTARYVYDVLGNVVSVTDAKNITITNFYDKAGRTTKRTYSDGTPQVEYFYDGKGLPQVPQFAKGALTKVTSAVSEDRFTSFDNHGRLLASQQITDGQTYSFGYKYNLSGGLLEETYPSGRIVRNFLDSDGGLSAVNTKAANGLVKPVASDFDYSATGGIKKMKLGNGLWETAQVNQLQQLTQVGLGTTQTNNSLFKIDYEYGELNTDGATVDTVKNTGTIAKTTTTIPTTSFAQTFKYDAISRLTEARETTNTQQNWKQTFGYDRFGNRSQFTQIVGTEQLQLTNINHPTIDQTNNRFTTGQGYVYDLNGNLIQDAEGRSFTFNGDDKQTEVRNAGNQVIGQYVYDGSGARVKKHVPSTGETTVFVYDAGGALAAEYSTQTPPSDPKTSYLTTDHLGSPRIITDQTGQVTARRDFMPFGEELGTGVGGRTEALKYSYIGSDRVRKRFTGYEKDDETGLDFAEARMYQNKHGRFTAPDPLLASANPANPQTFNRYTYTGNDPINYTDPSGLAWCRKNNGATSFVGENIACSKDDGEDVTNSVVTITGGDWSKEKAKPGDTVILKSDGTVQIENSPEARAIAQGQSVASGTVDVSGSEAPLLASETSSVGGTIRPRDLLPLPCPQGDSACGSGNVPLPTLSPGADAETVLLAAQTALDGAAATEIPIISQASGILSAAVDVSNGDLVGAGMSMGGLLPFAGNAIDAAKIGRRLNKVVDVVKRGPSVNPNAPHNKKIREVASQVTDGKIIAGGGILPEKLIPTPGGFKSGRRPDILVQRSNGSKYGINIGRQTMKGVPNKREAQAIFDLEGAGYKMHFVPYNR